ncbi:C-Jun-amino-terminal kinase-interacting protein 4-like isoform X4 [Centruroides vittatus]|uniref:C-Jun-amino-terminal kinase-interacting protein 4-like isoform X4 n=1 Tax=Centruroides vittatus TaxID=120091 RepID=UPI00350EBCA5
MENELQETVYGTTTTTVDDSHSVMSDKVRNLAGSIYQEFEKMISKYDEDVVKELMPLVVSVLEELDLSYVENQEHEVELELLREDNEQLVTQFEREKQLRKTSDQKLLEMEYGQDDDKLELQSKVESLESIVRMLELKSRNATDHATRLEEKESEMKTEYSKLHERYTELFKTHMDYMERTKILFGTDRLEQLTSRSKQGLNLSQLKHGSLMTSIESGESPVKSMNTPIDYHSPSSSGQDTDVSLSLKSEIQSQELNATSPKLQNQKGNVISHSSEKEDGWTDGFGSDLTQAITSELDISQSDDTELQKTNIKSEERRSNTLYQELSFQDAENPSEIDDTSDITGGSIQQGEFMNVGPDSFFGMGKEVENLIMENNELLATKNALNIVKDDLIAKVDELTSEQELLHEEIKSLHAVKNRLKQKVNDLEDEIKKLKEELDKSKTNKSDDEEDVPLAQRKRFTRVEMARVLMERNQYKERLMELQEAVRWTELIRACKNNPELESKKSRSSIWKIFSNLFSSSEKPQRNPSVPYVNVHYNAPTSYLSPTLDNMRKKRLGDKNKGLDFMDSELASERLQQQRAKERKERYKQVRAHVRKDDGRVQAYGWSLPTQSAGVSKVNKEEEKSSPTIPLCVPVPVYCRPLLEKETGMKIWCAAGVNLTGGKTLDGGDIVGASVFYSSPPEKELTVGSETLTEVEKLDRELMEHNKERKEHEEIEKCLSSLVWICTSTHGNSKVTVIDANNPGDVLDSFSICSSYLLCIASVPGAKENDYDVNEEFLKLGVEVEDKNKNISETSCSDDNSNVSSNTDVLQSKIGEITFVSCSAAGTSKPPSPTPATQSDMDKSHSTSSNSESSNLDRQQQWIVMKEPPELVKDGVSEVSRENQLAYNQVEKMSSILPTMWMSSQNGSIYVHSSVSQWWRCIHSVKLKDAVLSIVHIKGRVFAALADGTVAIFHRAEDRQWDLRNYHLIDLGQPHHSIRCMAIVSNKVWCGYRNKIHVVDPKDLSIQKSFDAHPRKESQVRQMAWVGDGVWVSIRLDSTLRLYHAHTHQHLQDVDIEPYVSKMLGTGKLGFSFVRITALMISCNRLWIGTGNGVIISVPLSENTKKESSSPSDGKIPGSIIRVYSDNKDNVTPASFIPYCSMAQAQLSFHGHRDAVKFFVSVPVGQGGMSAISSSNVSESSKSEDSARACEQPKKPKYMLVISGGEGYIDFRIGDSDDEDNEEISLTPEKKPRGLSKGDSSHLIAWQVMLPD